MRAAVLPGKRSAPRNEARNSHDEAAYTIPRLEGAARVSRSRRERTKKVQLERILQSLDSVSHPSARTEQYPTPAGIAAEVAYVAQTNGDLEGRSVVDLGCGNGVLAIAAKLVGARRAVGVDSDPAALDVARRNAERAKVEVEWRLADVRTVREAFETVVMNPPFGSQTRHADRPFLEVALAVGRIVYTFLNAKAEAYVRRHIVSAGGRITDRLEFAFPIRHLFAFHREERRYVNVILFRVAVAKG